MPSPPLRAPWRRVDARVHLSLSPAQLADPVSSATQMAFENLLMRYNHSLNAVVVAHIGPLKLLHHPAFIDASPFAHVVGRLRLLLFNPPVGSIMVGVITYVGPDHLALRVFRTFHAVLPLHAVRNSFQYNANRPYQWTRSDHLAAPENDLAVGRQVRFVVTRTKATREGLFQILASLDHRLCYEPTPPDELGLLMPNEQVPGQSVSPQQTEHHEASDTPNVDVLNVTKRSAIERAKRHSQRDAEQLLLAPDTTFGDAFEPVNPNLLRSKPRELNRGPIEPLKEPADGVTEAQAQIVNETPARHKVFADDDDDESQEEQPERLQEKMADAVEEEPQNIQHAETQRDAVQDGLQASEHEEKDKIGNGTNEENTTPESAMRPILKQKEELQLASETAIVVPKSQQSERGEEKSKDKSRKSKHDKKRKKSKEEKDKHGTPSSKRKKKRRHSDSVLEVQKSEPKVESEGVHLGLTEVKKKKKSKDKEKRKDKEKHRTKRGDKDKKKEKHRNKEKRKRDGYDLSESYREGEQSEASAQAGGTSEKKKRKTSDARERSKRDGRERSWSQTDVLSTKFESALEAVNVAPLVSQESAETKSEPVRDGQVQVRTQVQKRVGGAVHDDNNGEVAVKTQSADAEKERDRGKKKTKESKEEGSFKHGTQEKSERRKKKRRREKSEGDGSERKKKKKSRHNRQETGEQERKAEAGQAETAETETGQAEAEQTEADQKEEVELAAVPTASSKVSALASALSRSLARKWHARR